LNTVEPIDAHTASAATPASRKRWIVVVLLFAGMLVNYVDRGNLSITAVPLMREFHMSPAAMGTLLSAFFWTYAFLQIPAGYLVDRFGLKWIYAGAFLLWSAASAAIGFAGGFRQILLLRALLGVGEAVAPPASLAYIRQNFAEHEQGMPTAIYVSGMTLGPAVSALLGAYIVVNLGWRSVFVLTGLGALVWLVPWLIMAPTSHVRPARRANASPSAPLTWRMLLTRPTFWGITIATFFYAYYSYFCLTWLPFYLVAVRGYSFAKMGVYTAVPWLGTVLVSFVTARLADRLIARVGHPMLVRKYFVATGFTLGSTILLLLLIQSSLAVLLTLILSLIGIGFASSNFWALAEVISPAPIVGRVIGYQNMIASFGGLCAPMLTGFLVDRTKSFNLSIAIVGGALLVSAGTFLTLLRERDVRALAERFADQ
jgi:ACS family D-galactonate transporter-like MFS transporter